MALEMWQYVPQVSLKMGIKQNVLGFSGLNNLTLFIYEPGRKMV